IRPTSWDGNKRIMQKGREDNQFRLTASEGKFLFELSGVGSVECPLPALNTWHHVAAVYDGASMRLYLNGKLAGRTEASGKMAASEDTMYIGTKNARATSRDYFAGDMFDVRLYDAALLPEHITAMARP
ncbi:MAG: LamG domain-containing protein, partial [Armatimonadetes bacterium]|nr:LamG domain-containing protein [Armatimonadota bacterium]